MTVAQAIEQVDKIKPNRFTEDDKIRWLSEIDGLIVRELIDTHDDSPLEEEFEGYTKADRNTELIAPYPYDTLYGWYLKSQIDMGNMEIDKYNNSKTMFNNAYLTYTDYYNRTHLPKRVGFKFTQHRLRKGGE